MVAFCCKRINTAAVFFFCILKQFKHEHAKIHLPWLSALRLVSYGRCFNPNTVLYQSCLLHFMLNVHIFKSTWRSAKRPGASPKKYQRYRHDKIQGFRWMECKCVDTIPCSFNPCAPFLFEWNETEKIFTLSGWPDDSQVSQSRARKPSGSVWVICVKIRSH